MGAYNALPSAPVIKKTKRGEKTLELKEYIPTVEYAVEGNTTSFTLRLPAGDGLNLNPTLMTGFLAEKFSLAAGGAAILRTRLLNAEGEDFQ